MPDKNEIIAEAILDLSTSIRLLGNGNVVASNDSPGAIEGLAILIRESNNNIASSLDGIASAIQSLAEAVETTK